LPARTKELWVQAWRRVPVLDPPDATLAGEQVVGKNDCLFAATLGGYREKDWGWGFHKVVVKDGKVYDAFTGGEGATMEEYKSMWEYPDFINFNFDF